jgi:hypothetical protein
VDDATGIEAAKFVLLDGKANDVMSARVVTCCEARLMRVGDPDNVPTYLVGEFVEAVKQKSGRSVNNVMSKDQINSIMVCTIYL